MTARNDAAVTRVIAVIGDDAWQPIPYWDAVEDDDGIIVASSAEVAETTYTAFTSTKAPVTARLVVRRVRRLREAATGEPLDQQALDVPVWRHHAVLTDRIEPLIDVEREHRAHAVVEQSIAELKGGPLAHLDHRQHHRRHAHPASLGCVCPRGSAHQRGVSGAR